jgi:glyoxylase-like metal-dependent hydrolase (beta-lactamase superfamily II)
VDPGDEQDKIKDVIAENSLKPFLIVNTHGHVDHIGANDAIKREYNIPLAIHEADKLMLIDPDANLSSAIASPVVSPPADQILEDGDTIQLGEEKVQVLHTPGHSPGGVCLLVGKSVLCGDVLFKESVGRTDLPGSDFGQMMQSIQEKLETLPDEVTVYPGHGPTTTIGAEKKSNPFLTKPPSERCCE